VFADHPPPPSTKILVGKYGSRVQVPDPGLNYGNDFFMTGFFYLLFLTVTSELFASQVATLVRYLGY
jgi:hypothetical protein